MLKGGMIIGDAASGVLSVLTDQTFWGSKVFGGYNKGAIVALAVVVVRNLVGDIEGC
jgi:hypothetical protein